MMSKERYDVNEYMMTSQIMENASLPEKVCYDVKMYVMKS